MEKFWMTRWNLPPGVRSEATVLPHPSVHLTFTGSRLAVTGVGIAPRSLQRILREYVGVSPKWVLKRFRLHEAARSIAESPDQSWADVATDLGYFDQAHFTREFTRVIGQPPGAYAGCVRGYPPAAGRQTSSADYAGGLRYREVPGR